MARFIKCNNPDCITCNRPNRVKQMSGINHRLFSNNNSTATHWYPSRGGSILIRDLSWNHLAAIVDLYEGEAVKFIEENIKPFLSVTSDNVKRSSITVQSFLKKHVKAWPMIKMRQSELLRTNFTLWTKLFRDKQYEAKTNPYLYPFIMNLNWEMGMGKTVTLDSETNFKYPAEKERTKARIALKLTQMKTLVKDIETATNKVKEVSMEIEKLMTQL